jgi:hypothetical protein
MGPVAWSAAILSSNRSAGSGLRSRGPFFHTHREARRSNFGRDGALAPRASAVQGALPDLIERSAEFSAESAQARGVVDRMQHHLDCSPEGAPRGLAGPADPADRGRRAERHRTRARRTSPPESERSRRSAEGAIVLLTIYGFSGMFIVICSSYGRAIVRRAVWFD